jgi:hypothetical protein
MPARPPRRRGAASRSGAAPAVRAALPARLGVHAVRGVHAALLGVLAPLLLIATPVADAAAQAPDDDAVVFRVSDPRINESSGIALSRRHRGVVYTHNDSGGVPQIFALGPDGRTRAVLTLAGARARDWEAMAVGRDERGRPAIYVADIGDNLGGAWPYVTVYRVPEPAALRDRTLRATAFRFKYTDGPRNAETMMINPKTNRLYVASKLFNGALYEAPARLSARNTNVLRKVGDAPTLATDGAFAPDGRSFVIRNYFGARVYAMGGDGRPGKTLASVGMPQQELGESITYSADGRWLLTGSEGAAQPVYRVPVPKRALPSASPTPEAAREGDGRGPDGTGGRRDSTSTSVGLFMALGVTAAIGYALLRKRS